MADRKRYLNARSTLRTLLDLGVIPIINENDTVATDEIRFGDNDTLAALVTNLIEADVLIILTDQAGLYSSDPRRDSAATLIEEASAGEAELEKMAGGAGSAIGLGGMLTKVLAAKRAARSGAHTAIASGHEDNILVRLARGERIGTLLKAATQTLAARKQCSMPVRSRRCATSARVSCRSVFSRSRASSNAEKWWDAATSTALRSRADSSTTAPPKRAAS